MFTLAPEVFFPLSSTELDRSDASEKEISGGSGANFCRFVAQSNSTEKERKETLWAQGSGCCKVFGPRN